MLIWNEQAGVEAPKPALTIASARSPMNSGCWSASSRSPGRFPS